MALNVDYGKTINEFNEENNSMYFEFIKSSPRVEFSYEFVSVDQVSNHTPEKNKSFKKDPTDSLKIQYYIMQYNDSNGPMTQAIQVGVYFSEDRSFSASEDQLLSLFDHQQSENGSYVPLNGISKSNGYILVMIDPNQLYSEYTRSNNLEVFPIEFSPVTAINTAEESSLTCYPNPFSDCIYLKGDVKSFSLVNQFGQVVKNGSEVNKISVSDVSPGIYFLEVEREQEFQRFKVLKQ